MNSKAKITNLIFSFDHFILDDDVFHPVVGVISSVSSFNEDWFGICHATAEQSRGDASDHALTDKHDKQDMADYWPIKNPS